MSENLWIDFARKRRRFTNGASPIGTRKTGLLGETKYSQGRGGKPEDLSVSMARSSCYRCVELNNGSRDTIRFSRSEAVPSPIGRCI